MTEAIRAILTMRHECGYKPWGQTAIEAHAKEWAKLPAKAVVAALNHSTANQYQSVFPKEFLPGGKHGPKLLATQGGRSGPSSIVDRKAQLAAEREAKNAA